MGSSRCLLIVAVLFLFGCSKPRAELTIPEEELVKILADAHLIESALSTNYSTVKDSLTNLYYGQMYEIHGIDETVFRENLKILQTDPKLLKEVYSKVMDHLSKLEVDKKNGSDKDKKGGPLEKEDGAKKPK